MFHGLGYPAIAAREGITWCPGCDVRPSAHAGPGWADMSNGVVHFSERALRRAGLRWFLMRVAAIKLNHQRGQPRWLALYEQDVWAYRTAKAGYATQLGRSLGARDRARVRRATRGLRLSLHSPAVYQWMKEDTNG